MPSPSSKPETLEIFKLPSGQEATIIRVKSGAYKMLVKGGKYRIQDGTGNWHDLIVSELYPKQMFIPIDPMTFRGVPGPVIIADVEPYDG